MPGGGDDMLGEKIPYEIFSPKFSERKNFFEISFYVENSDKFCDCWMGFNKDFSEPYWYGLTSDGKNGYDFKTAEEMFNAKVFDGRSIKDLWHDIYFTSINGISARDWVVYNCIDFHNCRKQDAYHVAKLGVKLWADADYDELKDDFEKTVQSETNIVFTAYYGKNLIAFAHCSVRHEYVEGADSDHVGYLEAIYVEENFRQLGIASHLIEYCENWARSNGCKQFASDCDITNSKSISLHLKNKFSESARLVHFIKDI